MDDFLFDILASYDSPNVIGNFLDSNSYDYDGSHTTSFAVVDFDTNTLPTTPTIYGHRTRILPNSSAGSTWSPYTSTGPPFWTTFEPSSGTTTYLVLSIHCSATYTIYFLGHFRTSTTSDIFDCIHYAIANRTTSSTS